MKKILLTVLMLVPILLSAQTLEDWIIDEPTGEGEDLTVSLESTTVSEGDYSAKVDLLTDGTPYMFSADFDVTEGSSYSFSLDVLDNTEFAELKIYCEFRDASGDDIYGESPVYSADNADWQTISWTGTVPTGAVKSYIWIKFYALTGFTAPQSVYLDNASFTMDGGSNLVPNAGMENWATYISSFFLNFDDGLIPEDAVVLNENEGENDNGNEIHTWTVPDNTYGLYGTRMLYNDTYPGPADDWFISPLVKLTEGYTFTMWLKGHGTYKDSLKLMISKTGQTAADFTLEIDRVEFPEYYTKFSFVPTDNDELADGDLVYMGLHNFTEGSYAYVDNLYYGPPKPDVAMNDQTVTNAEGQEVILQSSVAEGKLFIVMGTEDIQTEDDLLAAVSANKGSSSDVAAADTDIGVSTQGLSAGVYLGYAVDSDGVISERSLNTVTVQEANVSAVETFSFDFEDGLPLELTIVNANAGDNDNGNDVNTWSIDDTHGLNDGKCLYNDTYPGPADDYIISPLTKLSDSYVLSFWAYGSASYPDSLVVLVSTTDKEISSFTVELGRLQAPGSYEKFSFVPTDHADLSADQEVYFAIWNFTEGSYIDVDDFKYSEPVPGVIFEAYSLSDTEIAVKFDAPVAGESLVAANFELRGTETVTFTTATVDEDDNTLLHLSGASPAIAADVTVDSIFNMVTLEAAWMYAGVSPLAHANILNPAGYTESPYTATFKGVVVAKNPEDPGNRVWFSDGTGERSGLNSYGAEMWGQVELGDEVLVYTEISPYQNQTEMLYPKLISVLSSGNDIDEATLVAGADLDKDIAADTDPAEKWEGVLVTVDNAKAMSFTAPYFFMSDDNGTTEFRVGNGFDIFDAPFNDLLMDVGAIYRITGLVVNRDGDYRIVPRDLNDIELIQGVSVENISAESMEIYPNPADNFLRVKSSGILVSVKVYDAKGALIISEKPDARETEIDLSSLRGGIYLVKTLSESGEIQSNRFIKR